MWEDKPQLYEQKEVRSLGAISKAVFTSRLPQKYHCRQSEMQACQQETRMTLSQPLCLIEIGRPWLWYLCQIANESGIWKLQLVLSGRRSVLLNDLHISALQVEILNALVDAVPSSKDISEMIITWIGFKENFRRSRLPWNAASPSVKRKGLWFLRVYTP